MRCPKCSFLSFDLVETCVKCGKNIGEAAKELQGTVVGVEPPSFFLVPSEEPESEAVEETAGFDTEEPLDFGVEGEEGEMDFSFEEEPSADSEPEEVEMDLGEDDETEAAAADLDLGFDEEVAEEESAEEAIGISDLAPDEGVEGVMEEELAVASEEAASPGLGLEDLKVDGIDLESTPGVAADSDKIMPSVKTGTALDDFDFDLGDLLTSKDD